MNDEPLPKDAPLPQEEQQIQPDHFGGGVQGGAPVSVAHFSLMKIVGLVVAAAVVLGGIAAFIFYRSSSPVLIDESGVRTESGDSAESSKSRESAVLPDYFPSDIPIYPDAVLRPVSEHDKDRPDSFIASLTWWLTVPPDSAGLWYVTEFEKFGWDVSRKYGIDFGAGGVMYPSKDPRGIEVSFSKTDALLMTTFTDYDPAEYISEVTIKIRVYGRDPL